MDMNSLVELLHAHKISFDTWGTDGSKTIEHLLEEIKSGEAELCSEGGRLIRHLHPVRITIFYRTETREILRLEEERQVFKSGGIRQRGLDVSLAEKLRPKETPKDGARRAFREELKIKRGYKLFPQKSEVDRRPSKSFPGLHTVLHSYNFVAWLSKAVFKPEGYTEEQKDKTTYFVWKESGSAGI